MAHVFTPGLKVTERTVVQRHRRLPLSGRVLVEKGETVTAETIVARTDLPGKVMPLNLANMLHIEPGDLRKCLQVEVGTKFPKGVVIAETPGMFGMFKTRAKSPMDGTLEAVSDVTGQAMLREPPTPIELRAYIDGTVVEVLEGEGVVVETEATFIQGIFGLGGERLGELVVLVDAAEKSATAASIKPDHRGKILVAGSGLGLDGWHRAVEVGAAGVIVGGFDYDAIKEILGYDLGVAITGTEKLDTSLMVTEGFGEVAMAGGTFELLAAKHGQRTALNGATQIRAGVIRPEVVIPHTGDSASGTKPEEGRGLSVGSRIRGIRAPYFGRLGEVTALPPELQRMESETEVRVLTARFDDGQEATMPRANVEAIER